MAMVELTDSQLKASELLATGETQRNVAAIIGVNVKTIQRWLKEDKFKLDMDKNVQLLKNKVDESLLMNVNPIMQRLIKIALHSKSEKTSLDACIYALNRLCGTPTSKIADVTGVEQKETNIDINMLLAEIESGSSVDPKQIE